MLDFPRYRIHAQMRAGATVHAAILRPETGEQIGVAEETPPQGLRRFLPRSWRGRQLEVREFPEPALVFRVVFPAGPWHSTVRVYDAMDERMGYFFRVPNDRPNRLDIYLSRMVRLAVVSGSCLEAEFEWVTPKGQRLAHVSRQFAPAANEWLIDTDNCLEQEPIVKMLLLAGVLVLAYIQTG